MQVLLLPVGRGITGPCFICGAHSTQLGGDDRWACPPSSVTSDPCWMPWWAWQEVKGEAIAANEANYIVIVQTVGPEERQRRCEVGVVVRRCCCSSHTENEVTSCVGGVVEQS